MRTTNKTITLSRARRIAWNYRGTASPALEYFAYSGNLAPVGGCLACACADLVAEIDGLRAAHVSDLVRDRLRMLRRFVRIKGNPSGLHTCHRPPVLTVEVHADPYQGLRVQLRLPFSA